MTRVPEMLKHGIRVGFGQDCVLDPWYSLGTADMLDVAFMGLHVAQMTSPDDMRRCYEMVTTESAAIMALDDYGLEVGKRADLVVLDAGNPIEAIRLRATRLMVMARGKVIARRQRSPMRLDIPGRQGDIDRRFRIPDPS
jgi:cytosine deaminase